jgi:hypothetical protein
MDIKTDTGTDGQSATTPSSAPHSRPATNAPKVPPAGKCGHGAGAWLRRQPVRMVDGWVEGGYTGVFEIICRDCGDHPHMDYIEVMPGCNDSAGLAC